MKKVYTSVLNLIGNTPLVEVENIEKELGLKARVLVKLEYLNPAGSVKDRVAKGRLGNYRTYFRQYRNRPCLDCGG